MGVFEPPPPTSSPPTHESRNPILAKFAELTQVAEGTRTLLVTLSSLAVTVLGIVQGELAGFLLAFVGCAIVVGAISFWVWRIYHPAPAPAIQPELAGDGLLRGSHPFERSPLPMRGNEARGLLNMVTGLDNRFGVLVGPFGSGKTSLVRAELLPRLAAAGYRRVYVRKPGPDLLATTRDAIIGALPQAENPPNQADAATLDLAGLLRALGSGTAQPIVIVFDQFDSFLLGQTARDSQEAFVSWASDCLHDAAQNVRFLFVIRNDLSSRMHALEARITQGQVRAGVGWYPLQEFTPEAAAEMLRLTVAQHETRFEADLIAELVNDLTDGGKVNPALLQVVATWLKQQEINKLHLYKSEGEVPAILQGYIVQQLANSADPLIARAIIRRLVHGSDDQVTKGFTLDQIRAASRAIDADHAEAPDAEIMPVLGQLMSVRLVLQRANDAYAIACSLLQPYIVAALKELDGSEDPEARRACSLLREYVIKYREDDGTRIPLQDLTFIVSHAPLAVQRQKPASELLQKSKASGRLVYIGAGALVASAAILALVSFRGLLGWWQSWEMTASIALKDLQYAHATVPRAVAFHPTTNQLILASKGASGGLFSVEYHSGSLALINLLLGNPSTHIEHTAQRQFTALAFSPDNQSMVSGEMDGTLHIWNTATWEGDDFRGAGTPCAEAGSPGSRVVALGFGGGSEFLLAAFACGHIEVWDMSVPARVVSWEVESTIAPSQVAMSSDGSRIAVRLSPAGLDDPETVQVREISNGQFRDVYDGPIEMTAGKILTLGFDADSRLAVGTAKDGRFSLTVYDLDDATAARETVIDGIKTNDTSKAVMSRDARIVGVTDTRNVLRFVNLDNGQRDSLRAVNLANAFFNPNGSTLVVARSPHSPIFTYEWRLLHLTALASAHADDADETEE